MFYKTLNNKVKMPQLGFGVYQTPVDETKRAVLDAIVPLIPLKLMAMKQVWGKLSRNLAFRGKNFSSLPRFGLAMPVMRRPRHPLKNPCKNCKQIISIFC